MMQCVTCKQSFLFAPNWKPRKNKENMNILMEHEVTLIHSYIKLKHEQHCTTTWIEFIFNSIQFQYIELKFSWNPQLNLTQFLYDIVMNKS
jgi:hypothetical protein